LIALASAIVSTTASAGGPAVTSTFLMFNGADAVVTVPSAPSLDFGASGMTIAVWMRPDTLTFAKTEGSLPSQQYVHWLGKGQSGDQAWTFRLYSLTQPGPRQNRISFYVFKPDGGRGCGSYFQDPIVPGEWMQVVGVVDRAAREEPRTGIDPGLDGPQRRRLLRPQRKSERDVGESSLTSAVPDTCDRDIAPR
jgi:hypothetical protein